MKSIHWKYVFAAVISLLALSAYAGFPIVDDGTLAGMTMLPFMIGDTTDASKVLELIEKQGKAWEEFQKANDARLAAIESKGYAPSDLTEKVEKINADLAAIGKQMTDIEKKAGRPQAGKDDPTPEQAEYRKAFNQFLRKGRTEGLEELQRKAMNTGSDPDGGFLVLPEMDMAIDRIAPTISAMFRLANVVTIGTAKWEKLVKTAGMSMRRVGDGATGGETTEPTYAKIAIDVFTAEVEPWVFNETLEDAFINLESDLADEAAIGFAAGAGSEFITGNGVAKARGITAYTNVANSAYAWGSIGYILSGATAGFAATAPADKFVSLQHSLKAQYRSGAVWLMNDATLGVARQMKDASGSYYLWNPDPLGGFGGRFLGNPVEVDDNMPDLGANAYSVAFGNFKRGYTIVQRSGTTLIRDNITAKGTTKFNFRRRFGGGVNNFEAIKLMKCATS
jgi:HK97 family phage major capsid protein